MRSLFLRLLVLLELVTGSILLIFAYQLPGSTEVDSARKQIEQVGRKASKQIANLRKDVSNLRGQQPELLKLAKNLQKQMQSVRGAVKDRTFNADGLETVNEAMGQVAKGLDGLATTLDSKGVAQVAKGFGVTADFLDTKIAPAADKVASALEKASQGLKGDVGKIAATLKEHPLDLKATKVVVDSLANVEDGLERLSKLFKEENLTKIRDGFTGMQTSLDGGADQVDRFTKFTIPKVTVKGLRITVEEKDFWPDGKEISAGLRKAAKGCEAAGKEMDSIRKEMPSIRTSLEQSHKVVNATRKALSTALSRQEKIEPLLKRLPQHLANLADELPQLTIDLAKMMRETTRLKEVATVLRQAEKGITIASGRWPELQKGLEKSATILRGTQKQLKAALEHREQYEKTLEQTVELSTLFAGSLPVMLEQMETGLEQQDQSLEELEASIDRVSDSIPSAANMVIRIMTTAKILLCLVGVIVFLHGGYLFFGGRRERAEIPEASR